MSYLYHTTTTLVQCRVKIFDCEKRFSSESNVLIVAPLSLVFVYEYEDQEELTKDRKTIYKQFKKNYFDGEVVEIISNNIYIVTSKTKVKKNQNLKSN